MSPILLSIYLTRPDDESTSDDKIYIKKLPNGNLQIEHFDAIVKKVYNLTIVPDRLGVYVKDICRLYLNDSAVPDAFTNIQFNFTGYPAFLMNRHKLDDRFLRTLMSMADTVVDSMKMAANDIPIECHSPKPSYQTTGSSFNPIFEMRDSSLDPLFGTRCGLRRTDSDPYERHH
jgi:hypothetical protein